MHTEASDSPNRWAGRPWSQADADVQRAEMRVWAEAWRWGTPCPSCLWPYEQYHLCSGADPLAKGPTDE